MTDSELRSMIRDIVAEVLAAKAAPARPNALVLFTGALLGFEASLDALTRLKGHVNLDYTQTFSAKKILDQDRIAAVGMTPADSSLVASHDLLIVPTTTVNMVAKVAGGIGDCLSSNVIAEFIMSNKPVVVATNAACPDSADKLGWFPAMPEGYRQLLRENLARIRSFGVRLAAAEELDAAVLRAIQAPAAPAVSVDPSAPAAHAVNCPERVVHESLVRGLTPGTVLRIPRTALITALAREAAASNDIAFERV